MNQKRLIEAYSTYFIFRKGINMRKLDSCQLSVVQGGNLDPNMADCYRAKADALDTLTGPGHYDVLDVAHSLRISCPMEYPDTFTAFQGAIEPFMMNPNLI